MQGVDDDYADITDGGGDGGKKRPDNHMSNTFCERGQKLMNDCARAHTSCLAFSQHAV